ncbi:MAG: hypothetical protein ACYTKD_15920 [Planctomycetota bacterium]|jgi:hypothetical protein
MANAKVKKLCLALMRADSEDDVVKLLKDAGYWDEPKYWRYYGDNENNYSTIGNQQAKPDAALVEKITNSGDAKLMCECQLAGIPCDGKGAPQSIREAVAQFYDKRAPAVTAGMISEWGSKKRTEVSRGLTIAVTGMSPQKGNPCLTISDDGEGQTAERMPETFLSLSRDNKLRVPFVQGKFNMGGTGVLKFCGRHRLQLILSRRHPKLVSDSPTDPSDTQWGITMVRREEPSRGARSSTFTYLAPIGAEEAPRKGRILRFSANEMPIFPEANNPYSRDSEWGTLIKLYEYALGRGHRSNILLPDGLLYRINLLLPDLALPIRLHECRPTYKGHKGSFDNTIAGLRIRMEDDKAKNMEPGFPHPCDLDVSGQPMRARVYAFKKGRAQTYRKTEGIIFTVNGQTHGHMTHDFFRRKKVGLSYLAESLLVVVDCSRIDGGAREDLFMNSRDRLSGGEFRTEIERALEDLLRNDDKLRELKAKRIEEHIKEKTEDSRPLEEVLESVLKNSPTLAQLFIKGKRLSNPLKPEGVSGEETPFKGKTHPTYFRFKKRKEGHVLERECAVKQRVRVMFESDVVNEYFDRTNDPGAFHLSSDSGNGAAAATGFVGPNPSDGTFTLSVKLPDGCKEGDTLRYDAVVTDPIGPKEFRNEFRIKVLPAAGKRKGGGGKKGKPPGKKRGDAHTAPSGISLPSIRKVHEKDWGEQSPPFDKHTALRVIHRQSDEEGDRYDFYVNMDNIFLNTELKGTKQDRGVVQSQFIHGMVLVGLGLLHDDSRRRKEGNGNGGNGDDGEEANVEKMVDRVSSAVAPLLVPMIQSLGELDPAAIADASGEAT